jgi:hypothetical protein
MKRLLFYLGIAAGFMILLTGCQPAPSEALPEVETLQVQITPAARPVIPAVQACGSLLADVDLRIEERFADQSDAGFLIRLGEPAGGSGYLSQIAGEEVVVILNPDNPATSLSVDQIRGLFSGQIPSWADLGGASATVAAHAYFQGDEVQQAFVQEVLAGIPLHSSTTLVPDPDAMRAAVSADPAAIGLLPSAWEIEGDNSILVGIRLPVLIESGQLLEGSAAELAVCLQGETGQAILSAIYP